ncbi:Co2+/Mg2+ efflux protein ApaG [Larsenimonas rhizosphaerae]|uniref:Co2+/Mg2+ efflux protein ApaG n=1 Tax=Larsenimonas rhizosphaerae TaxID=2944682 RepID=A0AA41ZLB0_9GAMM|nr:Co2+/Mg2+ efflux protein ApaG [Larsenimonas rhizosphaerae]MCM2130183.1 Co2+/Mg2+ efflux protein ApaG [Larsenimonas rhizosphaerae]MCX2522870.1 Co2+/Mg2+ efflux protein ApaG [Larsenimonas rhizosphaerae]
MIDDPAAVIDVRVSPEYVAEDSDLKEGSFVFNYDVEIHNHGEQEVQLLRRYWRITQGSGQVQEVRGEGVVGEKPLIAGRGYFSYRSRAVMDCEVGVMEGSYTFSGDGGVEFEVSIPPFRLSPPNSVH